MNRDLHLTFGRSVELLEKILPGQNWVWFLSRNLHGLAEGYTTIPFNNSSESITYALKDLKSFALLYGKGNLSEDDISRHAEEYQHQLDLEIAAASPPRIVPCGDFMSSHATPDKDYFQLSSGELGAMTDRIEQVMDIQNNAIAALEGLSMHIRSMESQGMPTHNKAKEMYELAEAHADEVDNANVLLAVLAQAIADRCERDLQELINALGEKA